MAELLLVSNPGKRKKHHKKGRMPAGLKRYWAAKRAGKHHTKHRAKRRRTTRVKHHRRTGGTRRRAIGYTVGTRKIRRRKLNPHRRHARHRRRNPSLRGLTGQIMPTVKAGAWGAAGALGLDVVWGLLVGRLPSVAAYLTNPYVGFAAKAVGAVAVGTVGGKVARGRGRDMAVGAMTVVAHDFFKSLMIQMAPTLFGPGGSLPLGAYLSANSPDYLGAYLSGAAPIMGTASIPQAYLPFAGTGQSGGDGGVYAEDRQGMDTWS